mgnify:CR=1 FL=1
MDKPATPSPYPLPRGERRKETKGRGEEKQERLEPKTKEEAIRLIMSIGDEFGVVYMFFDTKEDAVKLLSDMRFGHELRRQLEAVGIESEKETLQ